MGKIISIPDALYKRLEQHVQGFDSPARVIERILNFYEGKKVTDVSPKVTTENAETPYTYSGRGRKGFNQVHDYLIPIVHLIKGEKKNHTDAFHSIANKLGVDYSTVNSQCTRQLDMHLPEFLRYVNDGTIFNILIDKYPEKAEYIRNEIEKYYK